MADRRTLTKLGTLLSLLSFFCAVGGHWLALQSYAWGRMILDYSRTSTVKQALVKTFDGKYPCSRCKQIAKAKASEKDEARLIGASKSETSLILSHGPALVARALSAPRKFDRSSFSARTLDRQPPTPPPQEIA